MTQDTKMKEKIAMMINIVQKQSKTLTLPEEEP